METPINQMHNGQVACAGGTVFREAAIACMVRLGRCADGRKITNAIQSISNVLPRCSGKANAYTMTATKRKKPFHCWYLR